MTGLLGCTGTPVFQHVFASFNMYVVGMRKEVKAHNVHNIKNRIISLRFQLNDDRRI